MISYGTLDADSYVWYDEPDEHAMIEKLWRTAHGEPAPWDDMLDKLMAAEEARQAKEDARTLAQQQAQQARALAQQQAQQQQAASCALWT